MFIVDVPDSTVSPVVVVMSQTVVLDPVMLMVEAPSLSVRELELLEEKIPHEQ